MAGSAVPVEGRGESVVGPGRVRRSPWAGCAKREGARRTSAVLREGARLAEGDALRARHRARLPERAALRGGGRRVGRQRNRRTRDARLHRHRHRHRRALLRHRARPVEREVDARDLVAVDLRDCLVGEAARRRLLVGRVDVLPVARVDGRRHRNRRRQPQRRQLRLPQVARRVRVVRLGQPGAVRVRVGVAGDLHEAKPERRRAERLAPPRDHRRERARVEGGAAHVGLALVPRRARERHRPDGKRRDHRVVQRAAGGGGRAAAVAHARERLPHLHGRAAPVGRDQADRHRPAERVVDVAPHQPAHGRERVSLSHHSRHERPPAHVWFCCGLMAAFRLLNGYEQSVWPQLVSMPTVKKRMVAA